MGGRERRSHAAKKSRDGVSGLLGEGVLRTAAGNQGAQDPRPERRGTGGLAAQSGGGRGSPS